jgi:hypothetical protein
MVSKGKGRKRQLSKEDKEELMHAFHKFKVGKKEKNLDKNVEKEMMRAGCCLLHCIEKTAPPLASITPLSMILATDLGKSWWADQAKCAKDTLAKTTQEHAEVGSKESFLACETARRMEFEVANLMQRDQEKAQRALKDLELCLLLANRTGELDNILCNLEYPLHDNLVEAVCKTKAMIAKLSGKSSGRYGKALPALEQKQLAEDIACEKQKLAAHKANLEDFLSKPLPANVSGDPLYISWCEWWHMRQASNQSNLKEAQQAVLESLVEFHNAPSSAAVDAA